MEIFAGILGLVVFTGALWLWSEDRKQIKWGNVALLMVALFALTFFLTKSTVGLWLVNGIVAGFQAITDASLEGINFVFPNIVNKGQTSFFINTLLPIVFLSAIIGILKKIGVLGWFAKGVGKVLNWLSGQGEFESSETVQAWLFSQSGVWTGLNGGLADKVSKRQIAVLSIVGLSTFSTTIVSAYMSMVKPEFVVASVFTNMIGALLVCSILYPKSKEAEDEVIDINTVLKDKPKGNLLEVALEFSKIGFEMVINIAIALLFFIAAIGLINIILGALFGIDLQKILGFVFYPVAWLMGANDPMTVGQVFGGRIVTNEFVQMLNLPNIHANAHDMAIISTLLLNFCAIGSIAIVSGAIKAVTKDDRVINIYLKNAFKIFVGATFVGLFTATVIGFFY